MSLPVPAPNAPLPLAGPPPHSTAPAASGDDHPGRLPPPPWAMAPSADAPVPPWGGLQDTPPAASRPVPVPLSPSARRFTTLSALPENQLPQKRGVLPNRHQRDAAAAAAAAAAAVEAAAVEAAAAAARAGLIPVSALRLPPQATAPLPAVTGPLPVPLRTVPMPASSGMASPVIPPAPAPLPPAIPASAPLPPQREIPLPVARAAPMPVALPAPELRQLGFNCPGCYAVLIIRDPSTYDGRPAPCPTCGTRILPPQRVPDTPFSLVHRALPSGPGPAPRLHNGDGR